MYPTIRHSLVSCLLLGLLSASVFADSFDDLAREFWQWRAVHQPLTGDDIPRIDRPANWLPDWSPATVTKRRQALVEFEKRWQQISATNWLAARQVDYRLLGSAIARVRWELEITQGWRRNPFFYVDQTLGAIFDQLLQPPPFDAARSRDIVARMKSIPANVEAAKANLNQAAAPFAKLTIAELKDVRSRLQTSVRELKPLLNSTDSSQLDAATEKAIVALESFRDWLQQRLSKLPANTAVGRTNYIWFLKHVALVPYTPEQLLMMGQQEWERAVAFETYEQNRNAGLPQLALFPDQAAQMAREEHDENSIRRFLEEKNILTVPAWMQHYRNLPLPAYLAPLAGLGVTDDLTGPTRLKENGISYIRPPAPTLGYFGLSTARDPRPIIVHEGVPGHYFQLALSWAHENWLRRYYYDSGANEGIGFYAEEMMLQAGLFDDSPRTREIIYNFMRLRALRVEVDVKLATGQFTIEQAGEYLHKAVPMDEETAREEAMMFASIPGQAITYQIGKLQIMKFLSDARRMQGEKFSLRAFHDFVWKNGNVPIALQRWEYLGVKDEIAELERMK